MDAFEMAKAYYPRLWSIERLRALVEAGKLTEAEYAALAGDGEAEESEAWA